MKRPGTSPNLRPDAVSRIRRFMGVAVSRPQDLEGVAQGGGDRHRGDVRGRGERGAR